MDFYGLRNSDIRLSKMISHLFQIALSDAWVKKASGLTVTDAKLTTFLSGIKQESYKGKVLFTHTGISGPTVLNMSRDIGELLKYGEVLLMLDLFPSKDNGKLKNELQTILVAESNKKLKNVLSHMIPSTLVGTILSLASIDGETFCHSVRTEERVQLVDTMKNIPLHVKGLLGKDKAIVSSGGVPLTEVDTKTFESNLVGGLYLVGDILNIDRPSGGYSLQLCWTTGQVAGDSV
jgi:predicted Rossmann fold flavoprotein